MSQTQKAYSSIGLIISGILAFVVFCILLTLGFWQLQRLQWKENLIDSIEQGIASSPLPIDDLITRFENGQSVDFLNSYAVGFFDHSNEQHYYATYKGNAGYYIYTPLILKNGKILIVNRGFVPYDMKEPETRERGQVNETMIINGLARDPLDEKPSMILPDNDVEQNIFFWKDIKGMAKRMGLSEYDPHLIGFFLDADSSSNPGGFPIGGVTRITLPNSHLQYAVTWFGLALSLAGVTIVLIRDRLRRK